MVKHIVLFTALLPDHGERRRRARVRAQLQLRRPLLRRLRRPGKRRVQRDGEISSGGHSRASRPGQFAAVDPLHSVPQSGKLEGAGVNGDPMALGSVFPDRRNGRVAVRIRRTV